MTGFSLFYILPRTDDLPPSSPPWPDVLVEKCGGGAVEGGCAVCGALIVRGVRGRPRRYCSVACRRTVEFRVRAWREALADAEFALSLFDSASYSWRDDERDELVATIEWLVEKLLEANAWPYVRRRSDS